MLFSVQYRTCDQKKSQQSQQYLLAPCNLILLFFRIGLNVSTKLNKNFKRSMYFPPLDVAKPKEWRYRLLFLMQDALC